MTVTLLIRVSIAVIKTVSKGHLGGKGLSQLTVPQHCPSLRKVIVGAHPRQDREAEAMARSARPFIELRTTSLGVVLPTVGWTILRQSSVNKMYHWRAHKLIYWGTFFSVEVLSSIVTLAGMRLT